LAQTYTSKVLAAAHTLGLELHVLNASSERDFDGVFARLIELRAGGLVIGAEAFFTSHSEQLAALAAHSGVPTIYKVRELAAAGGIAGPAARPRLCRREHSSLRVSFCARERRAISCPGLRVGQSSSRPNRGLGHPGQSCRA